MKPNIGPHVELASGLEVEVSMKILSYVTVTWITFIAPIQAANGALIQPISGSTISLIGAGAIENVIDGDPEPKKFLILGPVSGGRFEVDYSVTFNLGDSFDLTGMVLWNNAGGNEFDGEGINKFILTLRDSSSGTRGVCSDDAVDTLAPPIFDFAVSNVTFVDLLIKSNHASTQLQYVAFYEIAFALIPIPSSVWLLGTLGLIGLVGVGIKKRYDWG